MSRVRPALFALLTAALLGAPFATRDAAAKDERLVQANFRSQPDAKGFNYTADAHGRVQSNYGWLFSGFQLNQSGMNVQQRLMTPDGSEYVLKGRVQAFNVTRRMKIDRKYGGVRMVEILENTSGSPQNAQFIIYAQLNYRYQQVLTNTGRAANGQLQKKEMGIVGMLQGVQGAALYHLCGSSSRVRPTIMVQNNQQLQFHFNLQVPAGATVAIMHGGVILRQTPGNSAKALASLFKPYRSRKYQRDLPREVRRALVNVGGGSGGDSTIPTIEQELEVAPGTLDQLAFSDQTLLQGTATCGTLSVETVHGAVEVPFDRVGALVGERSKTLTPRVLLHDGQKLMGRIETDGLRFQMTSGMAIDLDIARLDRLVMRDPAKAAKAAGGAPRGLPPGPDVSYLVETFEGNRLRTQKQSEALGVATQWGEMTVPIEELERLYLAGEETPGYWVELTDRSRFRAFVRDSELAMTSDLFGTVTLAPHQVRRILAVRRRVRARAEDDDPGELVRPHVVLGGGDLFVGRIDLDALHFLGPGGAVPQPPSQIRLLHNTLDGAEPAIGESLRFRADVWGGGHVTGELQELVVPVQTTRGRLRVPVRDLLDVHVPTPTVPEVLRVRLQGLVRDLGHAEWEKREAASIALAELGELAKAALEQVLRETKDPEVERRARRLLDKL